jgi:predicted SAM-dependent methyltransferase
VRLHFGCGSKRLPAPWVNVDGQSGADMVLNMIDPWEIKPGTVEWLYSCHAIEHVEFDTLPTMFARWHKMIDIEAIYTNRYKAGARAASWISAIYGDSWGLDRPFAKHCCCFDEMLLANLLMDAGFNSVRHWEPAEYPEIAALHDCATTDRDVSLLLEATA